MLQPNIFLVVRLLSKVRPKNRNKEMHNSRQMSSNLNPYSILAWNISWVISFVQPEDYRVPHASARLIRNPSQRIYPRYLPAKVVDIPRISINSIQASPCGMMKPKTKKRMPTDLCFIYQPIKEGERVLSFRVWRKNQNQRVVCTCTVPL